MKGLVNMDETAWRGMDPDMDKKSDVVPVELKKDGGYAKASRTIPGEDLKILGAYADRLVTDGAVRILNGEITAQPYRYMGENDQTGCTWCPYAGVCGFDPEAFGDRYRELPVCSDEEYWDKIRSEVADS